MAYTVTMRDVYHTGTLVATITIVAGATLNDDLVIIEDQLFPGDINNLNLVADTIGLPNSQANLETVLLPNGMSWWSTYRTALVNVGVATQVATDNNSDTVPPALACIGDSTVDFMMKFRWSSALYIATRSNASNLTAGDGQMIFYPDSTVTWQAPDDTVGPRTSLVNGFNWMESGSANKGMSICTSTPLLGIVANLSEPITYDITLQPESPSYTGQSASGWALILTGWRLPFTANLGSTGDRAVPCRDRLHQIFTSDSFGVPTTSRPTIIHVLVGINDVSALDAGNTDYTIAEIKQAYTDIKDICIGKGAHVVFGTLAMSAPTVGEFAIMQELNQHILNISKTNSHVHVADFFRRIRDGNYTDGRATLNTMDGLHYTPQGGLIAGLELKRVIDDIVHRSVGRSRSQFAGDVSNSLTNGAFLGTTGTKGTGITGNVADNWAATRTGTLTATATKEIVAEECPWQAFSCAGGGSGGVLTVDSAVITTLNGSDGQTIDADVEVDCNSFDAKVVVDFAIVVTYSDAATETIRSMNIDSVADGFSYVFSGTLRTLSVKLKPNVTGVKTQLIVKLDSSTNAWVKFRCAGITVQS